MKRKCFKSGRNSHKKDVNLFFNQSQEDENNRFHFELSAIKMGFKRIAGVDEVGRGALAGPVLATAVILPRDLHKIPEGIRDSKKLSPSIREHLFDKIVDCALSVGIGIVDNKKIDESSILKASLKAMQIAVSSLNPSPDIVFVDGNQRFLTKISQQTIIKGDDRSVSIGAASIVAKVIRDKIMENYHLIYPLYNFHENKGYGTKEHLLILKHCGYCDIHRLSYRGVI